MKTPDALFLPETWKKGETQLDRIDSILAIAEPLLNVDRSRGGRAYIRRHSEGRLFVTADPHDTVKFPAWHPRASSHRPGPSPARSCGSTRCGPTTAA